MDKSADAHSKVSTRRAAWGRLHLHKACSGIPARSICEIKAGACNCQQLSACKGMLPPGCRMGGSRLKESCGRLWKHLLQGFKVVGSCCSFHLCSSSAGSRCGLSLCAPLLLQAASTSHTQCTKVGKPAQAFIALCRTVYASYISLTSCCGIVPLP